MADEKKVRIPITNSVTRGKASPKAKVEKKEIVSNKRQSTDQEKKPLISGTFQKAKKVSGNKYEDRSKVKYRDYGLDPRNKKKELRESLYSKPGVANAAQKIKNRRAKEAVPTKKKSNKKQNPNDFELRRNFVNAVAAEGKSRKQKEASKASGKVGDTLHKPLKKTKQSDTVVRGSRRGDTEIGLTDSFFMNKSPVSAKSSEKKKTTGMSLPRIGTIPQFDSPSESQADKNAKTKLDKNIPRKKAKKEKPKKEVSTLDTPPAKVKTLTPRQIPKEHKADKRKEGKDSVNIPPKNKENKEDTTKPKKRLSRSVRGEKLEDYEKIPKPEKQSSSGEAKKEVNKTQTSRPPSQKDSRSRHAEFKKSQKPAPVAEKTEPKAEFLSPSAPLAEKKTEKPKKLTKEELVKRYNEKSKEIRGGKKPPIPVSNDEKPLSQEKEKGKNRTRPSRVQLRKKIATENLPSGDQYFKKKNEINSGDPVPEIPSDLEKNLGKAAVSSLKKKASNKKVKRTKPNAVPKKRGRPRGSKNKNQKKNK